MVAKRALRVEGCVTSLSWIPSEAISGLTSLPFETGVTHFDDPPPDVIEDLDRMVREDRFRFANQLRAWAQVLGGQIVDRGFVGKGGRIGATTVRVGPAAAVFQAVPFPDIRSDPVVTESSVEFVQTAGGRAGIPAPRRVRRKPFVQLAAPTVWTTLALTLHSDGSSTWAMSGASAFPRHWIYDQGGRLVAKSGMVDFKDWYRKAFGRHSPWGEEDSPALVTVAETALERQLATTIMRGRTRTRRLELRRGDVLVEQGQAGQELFLLLDGILAVEVDGEKLAEVGPGAILGERAVLEGGVRTATLRAVTPARVAVASAGQLDPAALGELSTGHRREDDAGDG